MPLAALVVVAVVLAAIAFAGGGMNANRRAFAALVRHVEAGDRYDVIAGGDEFTDYAEHPFVLDPNRARPLGTTASGGYQMVKGTWIMARDALGLTDFSPASQDKAFSWILDNKVRGGVGELVDAGRFDEAIARLGGEWEAFAKMQAGSYFFTLAEARAFLESKGGVYA